MLCLCLEKDCLDRVNGRFCYLPVDAPCPFFNEDFKTADVALSEAICFMDSVLGMSHTNDFQKRELIEAKELVEMIRTRLREDRYNG